MKNVMHSVGDSTGSFARRVGCGTSDLARRVGGGTAHLAKRVGSGTADFARHVGPRRTWIGVALVGAGIAGSILLVRYLRARRERAPLDAYGNEDFVSRARRARRERKADLPH
ncbi:MAG: hypothetical protein ACTHU0_14355 [Kofleriaceae bacterium]